MRVINVRNVHQALPQALQILDESGVRRGSRNGPVVMVPGGVTTVYERPCERVMFWPQRDANPAFHLYESLWMLAGRNDVAPLLRYAKQMAEYSDDEVTLHGAYGYRWRHFRTGIEPYERFRPREYVDQLAVIARRLKADPDDRRCVLQMWSPELDLDSPGKDVPCNTTTLFQRDQDGRLDLTVFCRSNDIVWGCYGANSVHFSMLLEYMALWIGCPVGTYTQVSVNWHAYVDKYEELDTLPRPGMAPFGAWDSYANYEVESTVLAGSIEQVDLAIQELLHTADREFQCIGMNQKYSGSYWFNVFFSVLKAHHIWRTLPAPERYIESLKCLGPNSSDWGRAMREWIMRRHDAWKRKMEGTK